jgi:23S rRNA pseudouridine955/2504/2580 synthase
MIPALYSDDDILIIDKPSGLAVQPGEGVRICVLDAVERDYGFRPFLVHRLDRETAGCLVVARSSRAAADMSALIAGRGALKVYRAVVAGRPEPASGTYRDDVQVRGVDKSAETRYRTIFSDGRLTLVEAELGSGRMHQIRQHFAKAGHPIAGDDRHGDFKLNKLLAREFGIKRLMLYAARLRLALAVPVEALAALPPHFADFFVRWAYGGGE